MSEVVGDRILSDAAVPAGQIRQGGDPRQRRLEGRALERIGLVRPFDRRQNIVERPLPVQRPAGRGKRCGAARNRVTPSASSSDGA